MRDFDLSPLFRTTVGFDRMVRLLDSVSGEAPAYPPYNIEKTGEDAYRITMAVAGFGEEDLDVTVHENQLVITGKQTKKDDEAETRFLYRGIAERAFERRFSLADYIKVAGASLDNGLLHVELVREVPEEKKPRSIKIGAPSDKAKAIEQKAA